MAGWRSWRRIRLTAYVLSICSALLVGEAASEPERRPNIVFILSDDQRADALSCAGNPVLKTPNIDALAARGTLFSNCFVTTSICAPSRASFLTGQYARRHGVHNFFASVDLETTYAHYLRDSGYYTGFIGKWGTDVRNKEYFARSASLFDYWAGSMEQSNYWHERTCNFVTNDGTDHKQSFYCDCPKDANGRTGEQARTGKSNIKDPVHLTTYVIPKKVRDFLDARDPDRPFCLSISMKSPHGPLDYALRFSDAFAGVEMPVGKTANGRELIKMLNARTGFAAAQGKDFDIDDHRADGRLQILIKDYYRLVLGLDYAVGEIQGELEARGLAANTIIIFASDNGLLLGEHGLVGKWLMYEESIRVPMIVYDPRSPEAQISNEMVLNIDIAPTILEYAGIDVPEAMQGKSLIPLLKNPEGPFREAWFYEHLHTRGKHTHPPQTPNHIERSEGVRTQDWKYIKYLDHEGPGSEELYHLAADPLEQHDVAQSEGYEDRLERLRALHEEFLATLP